MYHDSNPILKLFIDIDSEICQHIAAADVHDGGVVLLIGDCNRFDAAAPKKKIVIHKVRIKYFQTLKILNVRLECLCVKV